MRVLKGKKLSGHMGNETVTIQNLEIIEVCLEDNYILVSGNVPGPKKSIVLIKSAVKGGKVNPKEIIINTEATAQEEVVEETTEVVEETPVAEETVEETVEETATEEVVEENNDVEETTEA